MIGSPASVFRAAGYFKIDIIKKLILKMVKFIGSSLSFDDTERPWQNNPIITYG